MERKLYVKPDVSFEDFLISESIANCSPNAIVNANDRACLSDIFPGFGDPDDILADADTFVAQFNCNVILNEGESYDGYCYHTLDDGMALFQS